MKTLASVITLALALTAAVPASAQTTEAYEKQLRADYNCRLRHPITIGGTAAAVLATGCWEPRTRSTSTSAAGRVERWHFEIGGGQRYVTLVNGIVRDISDVNVRGY